MGHRRRGKGRAAGTASNTHKSLGRASTTKDREGTIIRGEGAELMTQGATRATRDGDPRMPAHSRATDRLRGGF